MADNYTVLDSAEVEKTFASTEISGAVQVPHHIAVTEAGDILSNDPYLDIGRGAITGMAGVNKFGRNPDIDTGSVPEDLWTHGGVWVAPTTARTHDLVSSDANDTAAGTGVRTVMISGLDASWDEQSETVIMNGTSNVATANTYVRIFRMYGVTAGSGGTNAGAITATAQTDATVTAEIAIGMGQTLMAIYTVPADKTAYQVEGTITANRAGTTSGAQADFEIRIRPAADTATPVWRVAWSGGATLDGTSQIKIAKKPYGAIPEKTDIVARCTYTSDSNMDVSAEFNLILVDN